MFTTESSVTTSFTSHSYHFVVVKVRLLKLYSLGNFQVHNAALLTIVTMLHLGSLELIHSIIKICTHWPIPQFFFEEPAQCFLYWFPCHVLLGHICMSLLLDSWVCSIVLYVSFYVNTHCSDYHSFVIQFEIRKREAYTFVFLKIPLLFRVFCDSMQILRLLFLFL